MKTLWTKRIDCRQKCNTVYNLNINIYILNPNELFSLDTYYSRKKVCISPVGSI